MTQILVDAKGRTRARARQMFDGFVRETVKTSGAEINLVHGGSGPPVLLLHGSPQTHAVWHELAPVLAESHTVVAADLRGYGDSSKPLGGGDHSAYSFRAMAGDGGRWRAMAGDGGRSGRGAARVGP